MKKAIWIVMAVMAALSLGALALAFETPTIRKEQNPPYLDSKVSFGLINATGTTSEKNMGSEYCAWQFAASRIGTGSIVLHLQVAKDAVQGTPYGFVNITGTSGHTVDTDTDNLGFGISELAGHCGQYPRLKIDSGADAFGNSITNAVIIGIGRGR